MIWHPSFLSTGLRRLGSVSPIFQKPYLIGSMQFFHPGRYISFSALLQKLSTIQRYCSVIGNAAVMASFIPVSPSEQRIRISRTPRFFRLFRILSQYLLLSFSLITRVSTSFFPFALMPRITYAASFRSTPSSRTEKCTASMNTIG